MKWIIELKNRPEHFGPKCAFNQRKEKLYHRKKVVGICLAEKGEFSNPNNLSKNILFFWDGLFVSFRYNVYFYFAMGQSFYISLFLVLFVSQLVEWALNKQTTLILTTNRSILVMELTQIIQTMELFSINLIGPLNWMNWHNTLSVAFSVRLCLSCFCHTRYMILYVEN